MRRLLLISPHFPPDSSAGTHRARLLAPHLDAYGWRPTVVTVDPRDYVGTLDADLERLVPATVDVRRSRAWSASTTRRLGFADLGLRAFAGLRRLALDTLAAEPHHAAFITIYPTYPALIGPSLKRRGGIPFVLDLQDPWVGSWGLEVGPGGTPDLRSRASRALAMRLEPRAAQAADAFTAVSERTLDELFTRVPDARSRPREVLPIGWDPSDWKALHALNPANGLFESSGRDRNVCYVGTLLPAGHAIVRAFLLAADRLIEQRSDLASTLALWFVGTSNQSKPDGDGLVAPLAGGLDIARSVHERTGRVPYLQALAINRDADVVLLLGTTEPHYTASKLFPALASGRPVVAVVHDASDSVPLLRDASTRGPVSIVTYGSHGPNGETVAATSAALDRALSRASHAETEPNPVLNPFTAHALAGRLAAVLDTVASGTQHECAS
jgi:glycosyltransferase involved in cell wall biosynthesis